MGQKRLKRFWARVRLLLACGGVGGAILIGVLGMLAASEWILLAAMVLTAALLTGMIVVSLRFLRCTTCGKTIAVGWWNPGQRFYYSCCGKPFLFDDDPPDETETTTKEEP